MSSRSIVEPAGPYRRLPLSALAESPTNPRRYVDAAAQTDLVASIRERGILQPLLVRSVNGHFEIIAGSRRFRAAQELGLSEVPVIVREADDGAALEDAVTENLQREGVAPLDEARAIAALVQGSDLERLAAVVAIAERIGKRGLQTTPTLPGFAESSWPTPPGGSRAGDRAADDD